MRRWNLPQVNTKVMCAVLTAAMVMTGFTACGGSTSASAQETESTAATDVQETLAPESTESGEKKVETYLGQITAIDGNVISIALAEQPELPDGEAPNGNGQAPDSNSQAPNGEAPAKPDGETPTGEAPNGNGQAPDNNQAPNGEAPAKPDGEAPTGEAPSENGQAPDNSQAPNGEAPAKPDGEAPTGEAPNGQQPKKDMLDDMELKLSGDTMTITVNDDTIITIDGKEATLDDLQVGDTVSFFLDGETVTSLSVGMPENAGTPEQPGQPAPQEQQQPTSEEQMQEQK